MNVGDLQKIVDFATKVFGEAAALAEAGIDVAAILRNGHERVQAMSAAGRGPSPEEWEALDAQLKQYQDELHDRGSGG